MPINWDSVEKTDFRLRQMEKRRAAELFFFFPKFTPYDCHFDHPKNQRFWDGEIYKNVTVIVEGSHKNNYDLNFINFQMHVSRNVFGVKAYYFFVSHYCNVCTTSKINLNNFSSNVFYIKSEKTD